MLRKFAAVLIAATMLTAPALAQGTAPAPAAPATQSGTAPAAKSAVKTVKVKKHKQVKKAKAHKHAKHMKRGKHAKHVRHGKPVAAKPVTTGGPAADTKPVPQPRTN
jgi:hypothetical protein